MNRREFMQLSASAATLAAGGSLPLPAADRKRPKKRRATKFGPTSGPRNIFTEPSAIEPITGYLPKFKPAGAGSMTDPFTATYSLIQTYGSGATSRNTVSGSLTVSFKGAVCTSKEIRENRPANIVETKLRCTGALNTAKSWTLKSSVARAADIGFTESGVWDGKQMTVKVKSWTQKRATSHPLIGQWVLLRLLASGKLKKKPLEFDMLDNSTLRPDQTLRYCGKVEVPVAGGKVKLDCYAQTGYGILPTHYLVDNGGRVQLITQETVNWALTKLT
ncbi:MAG: hypothetical protein ISS69_13615 [Phycisphaerae bacterium]|nr:hypothetical protein [Phycisphaerae bacterium]